MASAAKVTYEHIVKEPGYCGGKATIGNTRVRVNNVVFLHKDGKTPDRILEYYPGAIVEGQVTIGGVPLANARVTAFDDAGNLTYHVNPRYFKGRPDAQMDAPHDSVVTDAEGRYRLVAPFSTTERGVRIEVLQPNARGQASPLLDQTLDISRDDARTGRTFSLDLDVEAANWVGVAFHDLDQNGVLDADEPLLNNATVTLQGRSVATGSDGAFELNGLTPGGYTATTRLDHYTLRPGSGRIELAGGETLTQDLPFDLSPVPVRGRVVDEAGDDAQGILVELAPVNGSATARATSAFSQTNGSITVSVTPGTYTVGGNGTDFATNQTLDVTAVEVVSGTGASVNDAGELVIEVGATGVEVRVSVARRA